MKVFNILLTLLCFSIASFVLAQENQEYNPHSLKSHGYLRTGLGRSLSGGEMVQFQAPGAMVKPRLGNEANHYSELQFDYTYQLKNSDQSYDVVYMMATYLPYTSKDLTKDIRPQTTQLYFKWNNIYKGIDVWVGKRYYQRENIDILDWFWLNSAQTADIGFGVEQIPIKNKQNLNIALMRFSEELQDPAQVGELVESYKLDVRLKDIALSDKVVLNLLGQVGHRPALEDSNYKSLTDFSLGTWATYKNNNFFNRTSAIYRTGGNIIANPYSGKSLLEIDVTGTRNIDLDKAKDLQLTSDFRYDDHHKNGFLGALTYHYRDFGIQTLDNKDKTMQHINATGRYSRYITKNFNLTLETGYDWVTHKGGVSGGLFKLTFAPQLSWKKGMFSRPVLRPFVTYANWSKDLKGNVGIFNNNNVYANKNQAWTVGLQLELWW